MGKRPFPHSGETGKGATAKTISDFRFQIKWINQKLEIIVNYQLSCDLLLATYD